MKQKLSYVKTKKKIYEIYKSIFNSPMKNKLYDIENNVNIFQARDIGFDTKKENYKYLEKLYKFYLK